MADTCSILTDQDGTLSAHSDDVKAYVKRPTNEILARSLLSLSRR
jgi:hypothetical protein